MVLVPFCHWNLISGAFLLHAATRWFLSVVVNMLYFIFQNTGVPDETLVTSSWLLFHHKYACKKPSDRLGSQPAQVSRVWPRTFSRPVILNESLAPQGFVRALCKCKSNLCFSEYLPKTGRWHLAKALWKYVVFLWFLWDLHVKK